MKKAVLAGGLLLLIGIPLLWCVGRPAYRHHREHRAVEEAKRFAAKQDWRNASLSARKALGLNPRSIEACEMMASVAEAAGAPETLGWRRRVADLAPGTGNDLKLLAAALAFEGPPWSIARQVLTNLATAADSRPEFHVLAAQLALKQNRPQEAEAHFLQAIHLQPTNRLHELNLAVVRLSSTNEAVAESGRVALDRLAQDEELAPPALRSLVAACLARRELVGAQAYSQRLVRGERCNWEDRMRHLDLLRENAAPGFEGYLAGLQTCAQTNAGAAAGLCSWMARNNLAAEAFAWLTNSPAEIQEKSPVRMALAQCYGARRDWQGLESWLEQQNWAEGEFLRHGLLARAAFEQTHRAQGEAEWRLAMHETGSRLGALKGLVPLAGAPIPAASRNELLWRIGEKYPRETWAFRELETAYLSEGDTRELHRLYRFMANLNPADRVVINNLAGTSLLLSLDLPRARELARKNYAGHETDPITASTYAYSLHVQGQTRAGLDVLQKLQPDQLKQPAVALYYGLLLRADGQPQKATSYLALGARARLLPEEKALLEGAAARPQD